MKFTVLNYLGTVALAIFTLSACDAPDSVRFGNVEHTLSKNLFAAVPVDFLHYELALGDTIEEVQNKLGFYLELNDYDTYQQVEFKVNYGEISERSLIACVFVKQRLVLFSAKHEFKQQEETLLDSIETVAKLQPTLLKFAPEMEQNGLSFYSLRELDEQVTIAFTKDKNNKYSGCCYQIAYPEYATNILI